MRYCRFVDQQREALGILRGNDYVLDLRRINPDLPGDLHALANDDDAKRQLDKVARGEPPVGSLRRVDKTRFLAPVAPGRVVLRGGVNQDLEPGVVVNPGGDLPPGAWTTGVAAVIRHRASQFTADQWQEHVLGFTVFHRVDNHIVVGPWIVAMDEIREPMALGFSAFVDDLPHIRPTKALLDWGAELAAANDARTLRAGDLVCLAAPPTDVDAPVRSALVYNGTVLARLEANIAAPTDAAIGAGAEVDAPADTETPAEATPSPGDTVAAV